MVKVEVEVDTLAQLDEALATGVDAVLLDNMDLADPARGGAPRPRPRGDRGLGRHPPGERARGGRDGRRPRLARLAHPQRPVARRRPRRRGLKLRPSAHFAKSAAIPASSASPAWTTTWYSSSSVSPAARRSPGVVEPVEGRGGEEAVVAGEPPRRVPAVPRAVEDRDPLAQAEARPRDVAPRGGRPEGALLAERAGGIPEDAAGLCRQLGSDAGGEERVVGPLDPHLRLRDESDPEAEGPQPRRRRLDADLAPVDQDRGRARLAPLALVGDLHAVGAGDDDGRPPRDDLALLVALLPVVAAVHLVAAEEERPVVGPGERRLGRHRDARQRAVHGVEVGVLLAGAEAIAGEHPVVHPHDDAVVEALGRENGAGRRRRQRRGLLRRQGRRSDG